MNLTVREKQIYDLVRQGFSSKEIALKLKITWKTVDVHRSKITLKLGKRWQYVG